MKFIATNIPWSLQCDGQTKGQVYFLAVLMLGNCVDTIVPWYRKICTITCGKCQQIYRSCFVKNSKYIGAYTFLKHEKLNTKQKWEAKDILKRIQSVLCFTLVENNRRLIGDIHLCKVTAASFHYLLQFVCIHTCHLWRICKCIFCHPF